MTQTSCRSSVMVGVHDGWVHPLKFVFPKDTKELENVSDIILSEKVGCRMYIQYVLNFAFCFFSVFKAYIVTHQKNPQNYNKMLLTLDWGVLKVILFFILF